MDTNEGVDLLIARLDRIESKVDVVRDRCAAIDVTLAQQAIQLTHHIRRTDALEARVEQVADEVRPVTEHVAKLKGAAWLIGAVVAGIEALHWLA